MPAPGHDAATSSNPAPKNAKRAIRIQPTGYRRPSQSGVAHSSSDPTSPTPKSPQTRSPTSKSPQNRSPAPKSPTSYNHTPRTPALSGPSGSASPPAQRPRLSSRTKSAPLVAKAHENSDVAEGKTSASGLGQPGVTHGGTSRQQPPVEEDDRPGAEDFESDDDGDEEDSEDETNTRPTTAVAETPQRKSSLSNTLDSQIKAFGTPPASPRQPKSPRSSPKTSPSHPSSPTSMPEINIAVLGSARVGKSTFMQRALDLAALPSPNAPVGARKMSIDKHVYVVRLFELAFDQVEFGGSEEDENIVWPDKVGDLVAPTMDGALVLYDVTNRRSLAEVPGALIAMNNASLPCTLVSCKCDSQPPQRQVDPANVEQKAKSIIKDVAAVQTARTLPSTQKQCMSMILRAILSKPGLGRELNSTRRRAMSNAVRAVSPRPSGHIRATSEHSGRILMGKNKENEHGRDDDATKPKNEQVEKPIMQNLDVEPSRTLPPQLADRQASSTEKEAYTFDQLVDRLLAQNHSKTDAKFSFTFLLLYRKFAAPGTLLEAIASRFIAMQNSNEPEFARTTAQLRYLAVVEQWVSQSPEDFLHPWTRQYLLKFIQKVGQDRIFAMAAKEIHARLESPVDDDDSETWPFSDTNRPTPDTIDLSGIAIPSDSPATRSASDSKKHQHSHSSSTITPTSSATSSTSVSSSPRLTPLARAREVAQAFQPTSRNPLCKVQWHALMAHSDDAIAKELARIDWTLLNSRRPRDGLRLVALTPTQQKTLTASLSTSNSNPASATADNDVAKVRSLVHVGRHIAHFNHVAAWAANLVLLRDKPKHRALMLEKLMRVARRLRELNDYCALGSLIAGLGSSAVARLVATRDLVPDGVRKDFMKLEILMSPQKSYFAYRLAWENSPGERVPYMPLVHRDLVGADAGSKTFLDGGGGGGDACSFGPGKAGRVNWRKFEIMGDLLAGVQKAQTTPYSKMTRNEEVRSLILDTKIAQDDDELYERSVQLEPTPQAGDKNIFQRMRRR